MEDYLDIYKNILELSGTALEGVEHIHERAIMGYFGETAALFTDVADSFHEMKKALTCCLPDYAESELNRVAKDVVRGMQLLLTAYEGDKEVRPLVVLQFSLVPGFRRWHEALQKELNTLCASSMN